MVAAKLTKCKHMFHAICLRKWLYMQVCLRGNLQKNTVYLKTLSKLRLTSFPPTLFLTKC